MKIGHLVSLACVLLVFAITGCETGDNAGSAGVGGGGNMKTQGVYTTLALSKPGLDLPGTAYSPKTSFGVGESPAAVIVGYGEYNQQQLVTLELIESGTGRSMLFQNHYASYGKAEVVWLPIRISGNYELRLTSGGTRLDNCSFSVKRTNDDLPAPLPGAVSAAKYAEGVFSVSIRSGDLLDAFEDYDSRLIRTVSAAVRKPAVSANADTFAQRFPGDVVIRFHLDFQGRLAGPRILQNTLGADCAEVFKNALLDRSPYPAWPEDAHRSLGVDDRSITMTIRYE
jgi:hypothetical protein